MNREGFDGCLKEPVDTILRSTEVADKESTEQLTRDLTKFIVNASDVSMPRKPLPTFNSTLRSVENEQIAEADEPQFTLEESRTILKHLPNDKSSGADLIYLFIDSFIESTSEID